MIVFVISVCVKTLIHLNQLKRCIDSIKKFHEDENIYLINDSSYEFYDNVINLSLSYKNIFITNTINKGSADQMVFKFILENNKINDDDHCIILQDSMILNKKLLKINEIDNIKFLWHFTNHRLHWDIIEEPQNLFNVKNKILTHNDLIKYIIDTQYEGKFREYALDKLKKKNDWCGCFGNCCIIKKSWLNDIEKRIKFVDLFSMSTDNRYRRANESIFALICHYCLSCNNFEESYDGLYYDGINAFVQIPTGFDNLNWCTVHDFVSKISFNR